MKIEEVISQWADDAKIDDLELDASAMSGPVLHAKYLKLLSQQRMKYRSFMIKKKDLERRLREYYKGDLNTLPEELAVLKKEPWRRKVLKQDIDSYVESDPLFVELTVKIAYVDEFVKVLEEILKGINNRGFQIKNAIEWRKLTHFGAGA